MNQPVVPNLKVDSLRAFPFLTFKRAIFLLTCLLLLLSSVSKMAFGQTTAQLVKYVNTNTGSFQYSVPLVQIPSPDGPSVALTASYSSGIRVHQDAGLIGLGWSMPVGEITRIVNGVPDDFNGEEVITDNFDGTKSKTLTTYGPMYFNALNSTSPSNGPSSYSEDVMDLFENERGLIFPNYDDFMVNTPFMSGRMRLSLHETGKLKHESLINSSDKNGPVEYEYAANNNGQGSSEFAGNKLVMRFEDEKWAADTESNNKSYGTRHIQYLINSEIEQGQTGLLKPSLSSSVLSVNRTGPHYSGLIGGIIITDESGFQYHFALPVYARNFKSFSYPFEWDGAQGQWEPSASGNEKRTHYNTNNEPVYAISWKLTAVIGPDFKDENDNDLPDEGDRGYWVRYDYAGWVSSSSPSNDFNWFTQSTPYINGSEQDQSVFQISPRQRGYNYKEKEMEPSGFKNSLTRTEQQTELYYPDRIVTASHAACFFYKLRDDGHSFNTVQKVIAKPRLTRVLVIDKTRLPQVGTDRIMFRNGLQSPSSSTTGLGLLEDLSSNYSSIVNDVFQGALFGHDYSLCKGIPNNVSNWSYQGISSPLLSPLDGNSNCSLYNMFGSTSSSGGRLTLNKIDLLGVKMKYSGSPYEFSYDSNPNFNSKKIDRWGFYHSGKQEWFEGDLHTSSSSADQTSAWSITDIDLPGGGKLEINYESNEFATAWTNAGSVEAPSEILFVKSFSSSPEKIELFPGSDIGLLASAQNVFVNLVFKQSCQNSNDPILIRKHRHFSPSQVTSAGIGSNGGQQYSFTQPLENSCLPPPPAVNLDYGYLLLDFQSLKGYGSRVSSVVLKNDGISGTDTYQVNFEYNQGIGVSPPSRFITSGLALRYNNSSASFLSLPSSIYYLEAKAHFASGFGTTHSLGSVSYHYKRPFKASYSVTGPSDCVPGKVFIPHFYSQIPMRWLHDSINAQSSSPHTYMGNRIPALIEDIVLNANLNVVGNYAPIPSLSSGSIPLSRICNPCSTPLSGYSDECDAPVYASANSVPYYTEHYSPNSLSKTVTGSYFVGGYGLLDSIVTKNSSNQVINVSKYKYGSLLSSNSERFTYKLVSPVYPNLMGMMSLRTDVVVPMGKVSWSDQGLKETRVISRNKFGQIKEESIFTSGEGTMLTSTTYMHDEVGADSEFKPLRLNNSNGNRISASSVQKQELLKSSRPNFYTQDVPAGSYCLGVSRNEYSSTVPVFKPCGTSNASLPSDYPLIQAKSTFSKDCSGTPSNSEEVTLVDHNFRPIEVYNETTQQYTAIIRDYSEGTVIASIPGARYGSVGVSGFEYVEDRGCGTSMYSTGINYPTSSQQGSTTMLDIYHTGNTRLGLQNSSGQVSWNSSVTKGLVVGKSYKLSIWVMGNAQIKVVSVGGSSTTKTFTRSAALSNGAITANGWTLIEGTYFLPQGASGVTVFFEAPSGEAYFDDFRFHPSECSVIVAYPDKFNRTHFTLDEQNFYTRYEYSENVNTSTGIYQYITTTYRETSLGEKKTQKNVINAK